MYEPVRSFPNSRMANFRVAHPTSKEPHAAPTGRRSGPRTPARRRPHEAGDPRGRDERVRRTRLRGRARGRDRRPDPHDEADDLLLLRRQGAALRRRAGGRVRRDPRRRARGRRRPPRPPRGDPPPRRADVRPPRVAPGLHPARQHRERPPRRAHREVLELHAPQLAGDRPHRADPRPRPRGGGVQARRRRGGRPHAHQLLLRLPRGQPPHVRHDLRSRPARPRAPRPLPGDARRPRRRLPHRRRRLSGARPRRARSHAPVALVARCTRHQRANGRTGDDVASAVMRPGGRGGRAWASAALCALAILGGVLAPGRAAAAPASGAPDLTVTDTTTGDFAAGTPSGTLTGATGSGDDGEVQLAPALGTDFAGDALPAGWTATPWADGGAATVADGPVSVDGARVGTDATYGLGRALEFEATFSDTPFENAGFGVDFGDAPWAMFSTGGGALPVALYARTNTGGTVQDTPIAGVSPTVPHRYRIEWTATGVDYSVDGVKVASHPAAFTSDLRPLASDFALGGGGVTVDWLRMGPYEPTGTFTSRVLDAGSAGAHWQTLDAALDAPDGTAVTFETRSGATADPDAAWSDWAAVGAGGAVTSPAGRYVQYRATLTGGTDLLTPTIDSVTISATADRPPGGGGATPPADSGTTIRQTPTAGAPAGTTAPSAP